MDDVINFSYDIDI